MCNNARRLVQLTNENLVTYRFDYDPMNRIHAEIGFDNRKTIYHYNEKGELDTQQEFGTDNHKQVLRTTEFKRDNLGRIIAEQVSQFDGQRQQTTYHYDQLSRLSQLADEQTTIHFTYDNVGRVIEHHLSDKDGQPSCENNSSPECLSSKDSGPVLPGKYDMEYAPGKWGKTHTWWLNEGRMTRLFRNRSEFFLHPGTVSKSCITINDKDNPSGMEKYGKLAELLNKPATKRVMIVEP